MYVLCEQYFFSLSLFQSMIAEVDIFTYMHDTTTSLTVPLVYSQKMMGVPHGKRQSVICILSWKPHNKTHPIAVDAPSIKPFGASAVTGWFFFSFIRLNILPARNAKLCQQRNKSV